MERKNSEEFLQSKEWRDFQAAVGHRTFLVEIGGFASSIIEHKLPIAGKYFYIPRGPKIGISNDQFPMTNQIPNPKSQIDLLINLAKKENAGWIRIEPENEEVLNLIRKNTELKIKKTPHDMQPKEILVMDITKPEEQLLAEMKSKTRYNIKLSLKHNVSVKVISNFQISISNQIQNSNDKNYYINKFVRLMELTAKRKGVRFHDEEYYRKMVEIIPSDVLKLYVAEYKDKIIAANLMIFFGDTAVYLHGATDDEYRNVMAPYLLQWQAIKDAKKLGFKFYDFGGIKTEIQNSKFKIQSSGDWSGITKFKLGFAPEAPLIKFPGSYDIIINSRRYALYRSMQKLKTLLSKIYK